jgi:hypothetical protein
MTGEEGARRERKKREEEDAKVERKDREDLDERIDRTAEETFPASDPPSSLPG